MTHPHTAIRSIGVASLCLVFTAAISVEAQVVRQLTDVKSTDGFRAPVMDDAGTNVYFASSVNPFGTNPQSAFQIFRYSATTGVGTQLTSFAEGVWEPPLGVSVSDDGVWLAFVSRGDLTGQNNDRSPELFVMGTDGTGLLQLTSDPGLTPGAVHVVQMAGNGATVAFVSSSDLTGGNPNRVDQVFRVNRDGTGLTQVTAFTDGEIPYMGVSDDGLRIAFSSDANPLGTNADGNYETFRINSDGTGLTQITSSPAGDSSFTVISGNGATIAFESTANLTGGNGDLGSEIFGVAWGTTTILQLSTSASPRHSKFPGVTDDGLVVYYTSNKTGSVWRFNKVNSDGTSPLQISTTVYEARPMTVSGSGNRLAWKNIMSTLSPQMRAMNSNGTSPLLLASGGHFVVDGTPGISADGNWIAFSSTANLTGQNAAGKHEVFRVKADGTNLTQVSSGIDTGEHAVSPDGSVIVFSGFPVGGFQEIYRINADGTGLQQLTPTPPAPVSTYSLQASYSADGSTIVFTSSNNLTGQNADKSAEIFRMNPDGTGKVQITNATSQIHYNYYPKVDATGTWVVFGGNADPSGGNPNHHYQVWRMKTDGTGIQQLTFSTDAARYGTYPDISGDGMKIVYSSNLDPLGTNPEGNTELFLYDVATTTTQQLTVTTEGDHFYHRISGDGRFVYFHFESDHERNPDGSEALYRLEIATGDLRRADGLSFGPGYYDDDFPTFTANGQYPPGVSTNGSVVFTLPGNFARGNPDVRAEMYVVDFNSTPQIRVSGGPAPTTVSWDIESGSVQYDVVRGELTSLRTFGGVTDLGSVLCVEDNSGDNDTVGFTDADTPLPGRGFFYLYRGSGGALLGPGSYGKGTSDLERVPASGDCSDL